MRYAKLAIATIVMAVVMKTTFAQAPPQENVRANDENRARAEAAAAYAARLAPPSSEKFSFEFRRALETSMDRRIEMPRGRSARSEALLGRIDADQRFRDNLAALLGQGDQKIWGGQRTRPGAFPDTVAIKGPGGICTGTVIAARVVLTAAHCHYLNINQMVFFGDAVAGATSLPISNVRKPVSFIKETQTLDEGDLALMFLDQDAPVAPRRLAPVSMIEGAIGIRAVGFGKTESATEPSGVKRQVDVPIASTNCAGVVKTASGDVPDAAYYGCGSGHELVAGTPLLDRDTCNGDSGGPVFVQGPNDSFYLAAVTSRAIQRPGLRDCGDGGIYARVSDEVLKWFQKHNVTVDIAPPPPADLLAAGALASRIAWGQPGGGASGGAGARGGRGAGSSAFASDTAFTATLQRRPDGSIMAVPTKPGLRAVRLADSTDVPTSALELPLTVTLSPTATGARVNSVELAVLTTWRAKRSALPRAKYPQAHAAFEELERAVGTAFQPGTTGGDVLRVADALRAAEAALVMQYESTPQADANGRREVADRIRDVWRTRKAYYDHDDIYPPETYQRIFNNSRGVVAIARPDELPFCSGVLIAEELVLTAAHCLDTYLPSELEVRFNFERSLDSTFLQQEAYGVLAEAARGVPYVANGTPIDFAVLRIAANARGLPGASFPVQCFSRKRISRDEPLYVIGHPLGDPRSVHDNSFVYFPFQATAQELSRIRAAVHAEFAGAADMTERLNEFDRSYQPKTGDQGSLFENISLRWHSQPVIGADCDTSDGNSGSPAFHRRKHSIVGILIEGEPDNMSFRPGWRRHEAILPTTVILEQLDLALPQWRQERGVCIQ